jgi:hypothetical protein
VTVYFGSLLKYAERKRITQSRDAAERLAKRFGYGVLAKPLKYFLGNRSAGHQMQGAIRRNLRAEPSIQQADPNRRIG